MTTPTTFHSKANPNAEAEFRDWQWKNRSGFYINEKSADSGMLHRTDCFHVGPPGNNDPNYHVTASPKHCHTSLEVLRAWARREGIQLVNCSTCDPR